MTTIRLAIDDDGSVTLTAERVDARRAGFALAVLLGAHDDLIDEIDRGSRQDREDGGQGEGA